MNSTNPAVIMKVSVDLLKKVHFFGASFAFLFAIYVVKMTLILVRFFRKALQNGTL